MRIPRIMTSPLLGTAGVMACLAVVAVPLWRLTSVPPVVVRPLAGVVADGVTPAVLRLKLLDPAKRVVVRAGEDNVLLDLKDLSAGESEHDVALRMGGGEVELAMVVELGDLARETAVFLTVMPDGHEQRTAYVTGSGRLEEILQFDWHQATH